MLVGEVPSSLGLLRHLEYVDLSRNRFEGDVPAELCNLHSLTYLDLSANRLTNLPNAVGR